VNPALVDTSFLVAVYNKSDSHHSRCMRVHAALDQPLATCEPVISESMHMLRFAPGAAEAILASIEQGVLEIPFKLNESAGNVAAILKKYRDTPADFADACLIAMADELDTGDILTLDSDFAHYRWRRTRAFHMLIPLE
jgi:predicted nucleic acid-binding protein